jgi:branched-chain amino acid transport system permease protein
VTELLQIFFNSLTGVSLYLQLALGLSLFLGVFGILNFAQGDFATVGGYATYSVVSATGLGVYAASIAGVLSGAVLGVVFYYLIVRPLEGAPQSNQILATFGLALLLQGVLQAMFHSTPRYVPVPKGAIDIAGANLATVTLINLVISIVLVTVLFLVLFRTSFGRQVRAVSQNSLGASLLGIDTTRAKIIACVLAGVLSSGAALVLLGSYFLTPTVGFEAIFKAFTVVVVAGLGNLRAVIVASVVLAFAESMTQFLVSDAAGSLVGFGIVVVALLIRPTGIAARASL